MAMKRAVLGLCLALAPAAALVSDESCLMQSQRDVVAARSAALIHEKPALAENVKAVSTKLRQVSKQLPFNISGMLPQGMDFTMESMMGMAVEMLALFKNKTIVAKMNANFEKMVAGLSEFSDSLSEDGAKFIEDLDGVVNETEVLSILDSFMSKQVRKLADMAARVVVDTRDFMAMMPEGSAMKNMSKAPIFSMFDGANYTQVEEMLGEQMILPQEKRMCESGASFCKSFGPAQSIISMVADNLENNGMQYISMAKEFVPQVLGMVEGFAPDAVEPVGKMVNSTIKAMEKVVPKLQKSFPPPAKALAQASTERLHCKTHADQSGAAPRGLSLALLATAAAAWLAAA